MNSTSCFPGLSSTHRNLLPERLALQSSAPSFRSTTIPNLYTGLRTGSLISAYRRMPVAPLLRCRRKRLLTRHGIRRTSVRACTEGSLWPVTLLVLHTITAPQIPSTYGSDNRVTDGTRIRRMSQPSVHHRPSLQEDTPVKRCANGFAKHRGRNLFGTEPRASHTQTGSPHSAAASLLRRTCVCCRRSPQHESADQCCCRDVPSQRSDHRGDAETNTNPPQKRTVFLHEIVCGVDSLLNPPEYPFLLTATWPDSTSLPSSSGPRGDPKETA
jgi:hypothetical protein